MRSLFVPSLAAAALLLATFGACSTTTADGTGGGATTSTTTAVGGAGGHGGTNAGGGGSGGVPSACAGLVAGTNTGFDVDGTPRTFILSLPDGVESGGPWPVIFNWHGFGDTAANMSQLLASYRNGPDYSFILVTPEDLDLQPPTGMDWDILTAAEPNPEAQLFDAVLACLEARYTIAEDRIHVVGFSAGAIASDMIGVLRGDRIASVVSYSGVYFSNPPNIPSAFANFISWPAPTSSNGYVQILLHGGTTDSYNLFIDTLHFDQSAIRDADYLNGLGHDVVLCDHGTGHTVPQDFMGPQVVEFFAAHPRGTTTSPYVAAGLPADFPSYCELRPKP